MGSNLEAELEEASDWKADFSATSDDYENLDAGWYNVVITKAKPDTSKAGNPVVALSFKVIDGTDAGRFAFAKLPTDGKGAFKLRKLLKALGVNPDGAHVNLSKALFVDKNVRIEVDDDGWVDAFREYASASGGDLEG